MNHIRTNVFDELARLKAELEQEKRLRKGWQEKYYEIDKRLKETERLLKQFLNANTPPSQLPPQFKTTSNPRPETGTNPRGKPEGSNGATRDYPEKIDKKIKVTIPNNCQRCGKRLQKQTYLRPIYDIFMKMFVTEFHVEEGYCDCGECYIGTHPELPERGIFGHDLQAFITELKHNFAGSYEKISNFCGSLFGICFTQTAMNDCVKRVAEQLAPSYDDIEERLPKTEYAHGDETSWPVNGVQQWLWLFITMNWVFITIDKSRARRVVTDIFGEQYQGIFISDCLPVYRYFAASFQKDWIHLLRKSYFEKEKHPDTDIFEMHELLRNLYETMKSFLVDNPSAEKRERGYRKFKKQFKGIMNYEWESKSAQDIVTNWLKKYEDHWLTALSVPGIVLDNNIAERGIRRVIPSRKLLGGHRTQGGAKNFAIIETHRQTWQMHGKSSYEALVDHLRTGRKEIFI